MSSETMWKSSICLVRRLTVERIDLFQIRVGTVTALDLDVDQIFPKSWNDKKKKKEVES
jgi:hypothetical protein